LALEAGSAQAERDQAAPIGLETSSQVRPSHYGRTDNWLVKNNRAKWADDRDVARPARHVAEQGGAVAAQPLLRGEAAAPTGAAARQAAAQRRAEGSEADFQAVPALGRNRNGQRDEHRIAGGDESAVDPDLGERGQAAELEPGAAGECGIEAIPVIEGVQIGRKVECYGGSAGDSAWYCGRDPRVGSVRGKGSGGVTRRKR